MLIGKLPHKNIRFVGHDGINYFFICLFRKKLKLCYIDKDIPFFEIEFDTNNYWINAIDNKFYYSTNFGEVDGLRVVKCIVNQGVIEKNNVSYQEYDVDCGFKIKSKNEYGIIFSSENLMVIKQFFGFGNKFDEFIDTLEILFGKESLRNLENISNNLAIVRKNNLSIKYLGKCPIINPIKFCIAPDELTVFMCNSARFAIIDLEA